MYLYSTAKWSCRKNEHDYCRQDSLYANRVRAREKFWAEAASTAVYLIKRTPNASIEFNILEEVWSVIKVEFGHLKRFGSVGYVHTVQDKMSLRALKGIFMGYPQRTKGYRVWLADEGKSTISRNMVFDESTLYMKSK